jgi:hypothetical protein
MCASARQAMVAALLAVAAAAARQLYSPLAWLPSLQSQQVVAGAEILMRTRQGRVHTAEGPVVRQAAVAALV